MKPITKITLPVRHRGRELRLTGWVRDAGNDLFIFVHGLGCSKESWRPAWSANALFGRSLLAIDLPGFGAAPRPPDFSYALHDQARLLASIIDLYASRHIFLVAHSMGGAIASLLPPAAARRLDTLVLVEARLVRSSCGIAAESGEASFQQFASEIFPRFRQRVAVDDHAAFDLGCADEHAFHQSSASLIECTSGEGLTGAFESFDCRKAYVYGADNRHLQELSLLSPSLVHEIAEASHFPMNDQPDAFYRLIADLTEPQGAR